MSEVSESRMVRKPWRSDLGSALNKGAWSSHEDLLLKNYVEIHGEGHWSILPHKTGLQRCGRSCRLRWMNYLRPDVKHDNISADEEELIIRLHNILGNRWSLIAARLPGRTDNQIKNVWYSRLSKIPAKKLTQHCSAIKPVPYKYNLPSPDKFFVTANAGFTAERKENDNANDLLFQPANYNSGNAEDQMKQAPASPDIQELIVNFPGWQHFKAKDLPFIEIHNSFGYSDIVDNIVDQGFSWASSSMSPTHFNSFLASATHFQGSDYAHLTSTVPNANYVNIYGENQQPCKKKHTP